MTATMIRVGERNAGHSKRLQVAALALLLPLLLARPSLVTIVGAATGVVGLPSQFGLLAVYGSTALVIGGSLPLILGRATHRVWGVVWLVLCALVVGALMAPSPSGFRLEIAADVLVGLGWFAAAFAVRDFGMSRKFLYGAAFAILAATGIQLTRISSGVAETPGYSQYLAYLILPAVLIFVDACFVKMPVLNGALAALSVLMMLSTGARGPLVVAVIFVCGRVLLHIRGSRRAALFAVAGGVGAAWFALTSLKNGLELLQGVLERFGLSTRLLTFLMEGTLLQDRARTELVHHSLGVVGQHPLLGVGMANERLVLAERMGAEVSSDALGWYPHNIVLELLAQYGIIVGTGLIIALGLLIFRAAYLASDPERSAIVLIFVGIGLLPLFFSASYLSWAPFWALAGLCLSDTGTPLTGSRKSVEVRL